MDKAKNLLAAQTELQRHVWGTFVDERLTIAPGGQGIVTPGCEACRKRINTNSQYLRHLADDVLTANYRRGFVLHLQHRQRHRSGRTANLFDIGGNSDYSELDRTIANLEIRFLISSDTLL